MLSYSANCMDIHTHQLPGWVRCIIFERCYPGGRLKYQGGGGYSGGMGGGGKGVVHTSNTRRPQWYEAHKISSTSLFAHDIFGTHMQAVLREAEKRQLKLVGNTPPRGDTLWKLGTPGGD